VPAVTNRVVWHAVDILDRVLADDPVARIAWPGENKMRRLAASVNQRHPLLGGLFGFVDGHKLPVNTSQEHEVENATYNGWDHSHCISNVFCFAADGTIAYCVLNAPGSWHDSAVAQALYTVIADRTPADLYVAADTAFPVGAAVRGCLRTPLKKGTRLPQDPAARARAIAFDTQLVSARQAAEWGMRALQSGFQILRRPLPFDAARRFKLLNTIVRLHQVRVRLIGTN